MTAPYRDHIQAIRAALNVDARSLYKPSSWQHLAVIGYRETLPVRSESDLSKLESFQQDCMTLSFLNSRMPSDQWAALIVWHALKIDDVVAQKAEHDRLVSAIFVAAGSLDYPDRVFARWAVGNWGRRWKGVRSRWDRWADHPLSERSLKRHYGKEIKPALDALRERGEATANRLLSDAGMIQRIAA